MTRCIVFFRNVGSSEWLSKKNLEQKLLELISDERYEKFIITMDRLLAHPYSYTIKDFITEYRKEINAGKSQITSIVKPEIGEDGRSYVTIPSM